MRLANSRIDFINKYIYSIFSQITILLIKTLISSILNGLIPVAITNFNEISRKLLYLFLTIYYKVGVIKALINSKIQNINIQLEESLLYIYVNNFYRGYSRYNRQVLLEITIKVHYFPSKAIISIIEITKGFINYFYIKLTLDRSLILKYKSSIFNQLYQISTLFNTIIRGSIRV